MEIQRMIENFWNHAKKITNDCIYIDLIYKSIRKQTTIYVESDQSNKNTNQKLTKLRRQIVTDKFVSIDSLNACRIVIKQGIFTSTRHWTCCPEQQRKLYNSTIKLREFNKIKIK